MKKVLSIILIQLFVFGLIFGATIDSKKGYGSLPWGASAAEAQKAGFKLTRMTSNSDKEYLAKLYSENVDGYKVTTKDKNVKALQFHFYQNKLFAVTEMLNTTDFSPAKLESRYGNFSQQGIFLVGKQYMDAKIESGGKISYLSIMISNSSKNVSAIMYDWDVYKRISYVGQKLSQKQKKNIIEELTPLATKLVQDSYTNSKPSFAVINLTTDYKNTLVENYITDSLTEAMFNTGKIKIIERANLERILKEQKFQATGLVNEATAKSIGMIVGVDFVCFGTLKDLGEDITVNVRVVDVESGEVCAISRATITKDEYLLKQPQSAVGSKTASVNTSTKNTTTNKTTTQPKPTSSVANNAWKVTKYRNDFDGCTEYIFRIYSSDFRFLFVAYKKADKKANSRVIAGVHWGGGYTWETDGNYDIKGDTDTVSKQLNDRWTYNLDISGKEKFQFNWNHKAASRWLVDIIRKSDSVALRRDGLVRRFQTAGLLDKMAEYGITWAEIDAALANEEF